MNSKEIDSVITAPVCVAILVANNHRQKTAWIKPEGDSHLTHATAYDNTKITHEALTRLQIQRSTIMNSMEGGVPDAQIDRLFSGLQLQTNRPQKPELPPEIIEAIVDEVATQWESKETLKACLQVARSFVYPVHKHLFKSINLVPPEGRSGRRKAQKFWYHLLQSSPHIGVHVRKLAIGGGTEFRCYLPEKCERSTWTTCTWITCAAMNTVILLPRILPLLTNLHSLTFSFNKEKPGSWLEIPEASRMALEQLFQAGSLQTVKLSFITNLTSQALTQLFSIPNLTLLHVGVDEQVIEGGIYIQELWIWSDTAYQRYRAGKYENTPWTTCTWLMGATPNAAILPPQIFPLLVNLRSFDLSFSDRKPGSWLDIPEASQLALEQLFQTGSLQSAKLSYITGFTSRALTQLLNIPNLTLSKVTVAKCTPYRYPVAGKIKLQTLTLSECLPSTPRVLAQVLVASSSTESFSKFSIMFCPDATGQLGDALEELIKAAGNIRRFEWHRYVTAPAMCLFPCLSTLRVEVGCGSDFLRQALDLLGQISDLQTSPSYDGSNGGIKHLILVCYSLPVDCDPMRMLRRYTSRWNMLDKMLSCPGLATLRKITIAVFDNYCGKFGPFLEENALPMQRERGVLVSATDFKWGMQLNQVA